MSELKEQLASYAGQDEHRLLDEFGEVAPEARSRKPTEQELSTEYAAPGDEAYLPFGITYCADWKIYADGIAKHAREQVLALAQSGLPVRLESIGNAGFMLDDEIHPSVLADVGYLQEITFTRTLLSIKHLVIHSLEQLNGTICPAAGSLPEEAVKQIYRNTIVYTSWERDRIHKKYVEVLNRLGQVWVPCQDNLEAFVGSGVRRELLKIVPYPFDPKKCKIAAPRGSEQVPTDRRYYNIGKWEPRKNQHRLIGAFLLAHTPKDRASLLIKTSLFGGGWHRYPSPGESIKFWLEDVAVLANGWTEASVDRLVRIIQEKIPEEQIQAIHEKNNIYVSASAGEAWDIPAFEAKCAGNRLVHVGFGGSAEYADEEDPLVVWKSSPVHAGYMWEEDARWADYSVEDLAAAMKEAKVVVRRVMSAKLAPRFSHHAVGTLMRRHIEALAFELGCLDKLLTVGGFG